MALNTPCLIAKVARNTNGRAYSMAQTKSKLLKDG